MGAPSRWRPMSCDWLLELWFKSTSILASIPDALKDMCKSSIASFLVQVLYLYPVSILGKIVNMVYIYGGWTWEWDIKMRYPIKIKIFGVYLQKFRFSTSWHHTVATHTLIEILGVLKESLDWTDLLCHRPCLLKIPAMLQIELLKIFRRAVGVHFISNCVYLTRFTCVSVLKITLLKTILVCDGVLSHLHSKHKTWCHMQKIIT